MCSGTRNDYSLGKLWLVIAFISWRPRVWEERFLLVTQHFILQSSCTLTIVTILGKKASSKWSLSLSLSLPFPHRGEEDSEKLGERNRRDFPCVHDYSILIASILAHGILVLAHGGREAFPLHQAAQEFLNLQTPFEETVLSTVAFSWESLV